MLFRIFLILVCSCGLLACSAKVSTSPSLKVRKASSGHSYSTLLVYGNGVDVKASQAAFRLARHKLSRQADIDLQAWDSIYLNHKTGVNKSDPGKYIMSWKTLVNRVAEKQYDVVYVFLPDGESIPYKGETVSGFSQGIGVVGRVSNALAYSVVRGNPSLDSYIVLHELGHLFGARHSDGGVMAARIESPIRGFSERSLSAMKGEFYPVEQNKEFTSSAQLGFYGDPAAVGIDFKK